MPNKALEQNDRPRKVGYTALFLSLVGILIAGFLISSKSAEKCREYYRPDRSITVNSKPINLELADDETERDLGLSGRLCIDERNGMLFSFEQPAPYCFWMKDMNFPIDIIWLDANKNIVDIETNVEPRSYPKSFCPSAAAKYVLELKSGQAKKFELILGKQIQL